MKLIKVQVTNFRSVEDSETFDITQLTCLVGKNESGKSAILEALYGLNPIEPHKYDRVIDYPRRHFAEYDKRHLDGTARVVLTTWLLDQEDKKVVEGVLGEGCLRSNEITIENGFGYTNCRYVLDFDHSVVMKTAAKYGECNTHEEKEFIAYKSPREAIIAVEGLEEASVAHRKAIEFFKSMRDQDPVLRAIDLLMPMIPKFF